MRTEFGKKRFVRRLPANIRPVDVPHFESVMHYDCPDLHIYQFRSINLLPDGTLFKLIVPLKKSFPFFRKRLKHHNWKGILYIRIKWKRTKLIATERPYVIIHDVWTKNYYHWITQALPRLLLIQQHVNRPFVLVIPEDHQLEFHRSSLKLLQIESCQVIQNVNQYYKLGNVLYPTHDIQIGDYNDDLIRTLRDRLSRGSINEPANERVFIHRSSKATRHILNEEEVLDVFRSFGFCIVEFEKLTFEDQISFLGKTGILAGVHGAGLTNMIFMPTHSMVFELTTKVNGDNYYYYSLSNTLSHKYYYQLCQADSDTVVQKANLIVNILELRDNLTLMIQP